MGRYPALFGCCIASITLLGVGTVSNAQTASRTSGTLLTRDQKLHSPVSLVGANLPAQRVFYAVKQSADVRLWTNESELKSASFFVACKDQKSYALMDSLSALWLTRWEKSDQAYCLCSGTGEMERAYGATDPFAQKRHEAGLPFIKGVEDLPAPIQQAIKTRSPVNVAALPANMQKSLQNMAGFVQQELEQKGQAPSRPFPTNKMANASMRLRKRNITAGINSYFVSVSLPEWGTFGWSFNDYAEYKREMDKRAEAKGVKIYDPEKSDITLKEARKRTKTARPIRIQDRRVTFPEVMRVLHERYGASIVADPAVGFPDRKDVDITADSIADALEQLTKIYKGTEWELRPTGFFVVRSEANVNNQKPPVPQTVAQ